MSTEDSARVQNNIRRLSIEAGKRPEVPMSLPLPRRRRVTRETGRGLEMTAHAIESLFAAEYMDIWPYSRESRLEAIEILKSANREIYYSSPVIDPIRERIMKFMLRLLNAVLPD
jgi:hypothetical protein